jgi:hypothetical protein
MIALTYAVLVALAYADKQPAVLTVVELHVVRAATHTQNGCIYSFQSVLLLLLY